MFIFAGIIAIIFAVLVYTALTILEYKKQITYNISKSMGLSSITAITIIKIYEV